MTPAQELEEAVAKCHDILRGAADGFVLIARVSNENGDKDSYRYKLHGPTSEARGLIETVRTYLDEEDRICWREHREEDDA
jgi:hypothetical protein